MSGADQLTELDKLRAYLAQIETRLAWKQLLSPDEEIRLWDHHSDCLKAISQLLVWNQLAQIPLTPARHAD